MRFAHVKVRYRGTFLIFGNAENMKRAAEALRTSVSHTIGEKALPPENVSVEFSHNSEYDLMTTDLEIIVTVDNRGTGRDRECADQWAKKTAVYFFARVDGVVSGATVSFNYVIPSAIAHHRIS